MKFGANFRVHEGERLLEVSDHDEHPIVEEFLYEKDYAILTAKEKIGKSLLSLQLACSLSCGKPFLGALRVPKPVRVWYFSTEGKDDDTKRRLIRMTKKIPFDKDNMKIICSAGICFNTTWGENEIKRLLSSYENKLPKVIILDPLYTAIQGSLKDDHIVNGFTRFIRRLADWCNCAIVVIHHARRPITLKDGSLLDRGDEEMFGSTFLRASVDHLFYMGKVTNTEHIFLKCDTQRSGRIIDTMELVLHGKEDPDPIWWETVSSHTDAVDKIHALYANKTERFSVSQIHRLTKISRVTIHKHLTEDKHNLYCINPGGNPVYWGWKEV